MSQHHAQTHFTRRQFVKAMTLGAAATPFAFSLSTLAAQRSSRRKPNIVLIMADDLGYECLGCYDNQQYKTPNLDQLAQAGMRFEHCYAQPLCTPSRAQIMTGRYNHRNYELFGYLKPSEITFANLLQQQGYRTCIAGKWQLSGDASTVKNFGFDEHCLWNMHHYHEDSPDAGEPESARQRYSAPTLYRNGQWHEFGPEQYGPQICADFICSFIEQNHEQPFLAYYPMILTHNPFDPTPDSPPDRKQTKQENFRDMVQYMDKLVGQIVATLERLHLTDDTLLIFTGDNGTRSDITSQLSDRTVTGGKGKMTDAGTRVPMIAYWPGVVPAGKVCSELIDFSDFLPTLAALSGAAVPQDRVIDGQSFLPLLQGESEPHRDWIYSHYHSRMQPGGEPRQFARDKRWKLYDSGELYDVSNDVLEKSPISNPDNEAAQARERLQKVLDQVGPK